MHSQQARLAGQYLFVNPVAPADKPPERHAARLGDQWYFSSGGRLFCIAATELARSEASLGPAREVPLPAGRVRGLISFKGCLGVALQAPDQGRTRLFCRRSADAQWRPGPEFVGEPSQFCRGPGDRAAFFAVNPDDKDQPEPRPIYYSTDGMNWVVFDYIHATEAQHVHSLGLLQDDLVLLVGDLHFRHLRIRAFDQGGQVIDDPLGRHRRYLGLAEHSLYHMLPGPDGRPLFALDGPTILLDAAGQVAFKDQSPMASGFQVAAHGCFAARPDALIFGVWRRSAQSPFPCLYVATPSRFYKYVNQSRPFAEGLAWTGYQFNDATPRNLGGVGDHCFWPCYGCESAYFALLDQAEAEQLLRNQGGRLTVVPGDQRRATFTLPALLPLD
ncbi:hypothetical protein Deba_1035 [Desulfarculus baarsii DSM 2075]|uniref:Uncharacterized protein n=1 Tax=Desulfarculus baarsii (strain ATCC 33931 / DSM 2075 / LMG 7858 / VKM B-1802 / 2st14) TaxID=644282 RepID=E1QFR7_DESB2|nr:hypothetical protein [Desulfarculus baarsii]ADK84403.1 hypothetical protein Deba_1035 [Desulfarculus baarsii DSM 2075]